MLFLNKKLSEIMFYLDDMDKINLIQRIMGNSQYQGVAERKTAERDLTLQTQLKEVEKQGGKKSPILELTVSQLIKELNKGKLTSVEIVTAFCHRAGTKGPEYKAITESNFKQAIRVAHQCDELRKSTQKRNWNFEEGQQYNQEKYLPPLFGVPISIKDTYDMQGFSATVGQLSRVNLGRQESPLIQCLRNAYVIPFVRTNVPQLGLTYESTNNLWGRTMNPWNKERSSGGSSGGEAALISLRGSPIGVGSDIGGSIRIPANFCGVFGLKTYSKRISCTYHTQISRPFSGGAGVPLCLGPLGRSSEDLALWMKIVTNIDNFKDNFDPYTKIVPFDDKEYLKAKEGGKKYKIGYFKSFEMIEATPGCQRVVDDVCQLLKEEGHTVVEIEIPNVNECLSEYFVEASSAGIQMYREMLEGQTEIQQYTNLFNVAQMGGVKRWFSSAVASRLYPRLNWILSKVKENSTLEYQRHLGDISEHRKKWIKYWRDQKLDFVISPGFGCYPVYHGQAAYLGFAASYTFIWNILDMTTGSIPVSVVRENQQFYESAHNDEITTHLRRNVQNSAGLPLGVQVVGLPFEEQKVLGFMHVLEKKINFYAKHPHPQI